jgi:hypothetical protein
MRLSSRDLERALTNLDAAEAELLQLAPTAYLRGQIPRLLALTQRLPIGDPQRFEVERLARRAGEQNLTETDRRALVSAVRSSASFAERERVRIRSFRNVVIATAMLMTLMAIGLAFVGALFPNLLVLCFASDGMAVCPTGSYVLGTGGVAAAAHPGDVALVELVGLAAAAVAAAGAIRGIRGSSEQQSLPIALAVLKLPTGAITAVLGLLLMSGGFVPGFGTLDTPAEILAWALVFGYSQQAFTRLVDQQAQSILDHPAGTLGGKPAADGLGHEALESAVDSTLRIALAQPRLVNYRGILSVRLETNDGTVVAVDADGLIPVQRGQHYFVRVTVGRDPEPAALLASVVIQDGDPAERVPFTVRLVGGAQPPGSEESSLELIGSSASATVDLPFELGTEANDSSLWVRLAQQGRLIQLVELELSPSDGPA